ncbi:MAG: LuxR C-terminal-related transcriptional regulator [Oscillospiraceae bacterium]|nr:LuxR C-terminal-related transcriptional regulator [Oscillospiraceae bacterium]
MYKNDFLIFNTVVYELYSSETKEDLKNNFLPRLKMLVPFSYASIMPAEMSEGGVIFGAPMCYPAGFAEAEEEYIRCADKDDLLWLALSKEPTLVRDSDLRSDEMRLGDPIYIRCYKKYHIYDNIQYSIVYNERLLGVLTLFRTKTDGAFDESELFYLRALGQHLNKVMNRLYNSDGAVRADVSEFGEKFDLTPRETEILSFVSEYKSNDEIAEMIDVSRNTVQKHLQNIFRKTNTSSKWELMKIINNF